MIIEITDLSCAALAPYVRLSEAQLRNRLDPASGLFIAESPKVIRVALDAGYEPVSLLCEARHISGDAADIIAQCPDMPVYTASRDMLSSLTGYTLTRGVLCAMRRRPLPSAAHLLAGARRVAVLDGVTDTTNIGAIFRSAAALGIDAVLLTPTACDPLNRRAVRVSMGTVFAVPWTFLSGNWQQELTDHSFKTVAMALRGDSVLIDSPTLKAEPRLAIVLGTEGDGLADNIISTADYVVRIPMHHKVDSLNVAAASALAFWELCKQR